MCKLRVTPTHALGTTVTDGCTMCRPTLLCDPTPSPLFGNVQSMPCGHFWCKRSHVACRLKGCPFPPPPLLPFMSLLWLAPSMASGRECAPRDVGQADGNQSSTTKTKPAHRSRDLHGHTDSEWSCFIILWLKQYYDRQWRTSTRPLIYASSCTMCYSKVQAILWAH